MDFELTYTEELEAFRTQVGAWLDANAPQLLHSSDPDDYSQEDQQKRVGLRRALGDQGWLYPTGPREYGGGGLSVEHAMVINEELERRRLYRLRMSGHMAAACILVWGNEEQKRKFAEPILRGEIDAWQCLTEPQGGSDLASAKTSALRDGDDYVVNGQKIFVGGEWVTDYMWTIVNTDPKGPRHRNLSYLMIPSRLPGITIQPLYLLSSDAGGEVPEKHKTIVFFDDVRVPAANLIGGENEGWKVASSHMELEHGGGGNIATDHMVERLIAVMQEMEWDGKPLIQDPDAREVLGETLQEREIERLFGLRNFWMRNTGAHTSFEGPQLSFWHKSRAHSFTEKIHDLLGFYALTRDPRYSVAQGFLENVQRGVYVQVHADGGLNIQATILARRLGIGRNTKEEAGVLPAG